MVDPADGFPSAAWSLGMISVIKTETWPSVTYTCQSPSLSVRTLRTLRSWTVTVVPPVPCLSVAVGYAPLIIAARVVQVPTQLDEVVDNDELLLEDEELMLAVDEDPPVEVVGEDVLWLPGVDEVLEDEDALDEVPDEVL